MPVQTRAWLSALLLGCAGVINVLPLAGVAGAWALHRLYGTVTRDPSVLLMLQHRALLLGSLGVLLLVSIWRTRWRPIATAAGLLSMGSYVLLAAVIDGDNAAVQRAAVQRVVIADVIAIACLITALSLRQPDAQRASGRPAHEAPQVAASDSLRSLSRE
ncbi:MAG: phosphopantetheine adenylyltransferase [Pseudomonadota bacterium]|mgnify:CR=1 FL=1|nr:phosphopantetheine adenylyltransferase [Pseudomonadota bacterium]